jgi:GTPase SAR1 family protein
VPDYSLPPCVTLVFGRPGSGKSSLCFRYLANALTEQPANFNPAACVFIFDWKLEASQRFGIPPCNTEAQCVAALATRLVILNPFGMFHPEPGKDLPEKRAFKWFCQWVFAQCKTGAGKKILFVDEMAMFVDKLNVQMPYELQLVVRQGRAENLELLMATQFPKDYPPDVRKGVTEWICFNTNEPEDLDAIRPYFRGVDQVADFPPGTFVAYNRASGGELREKIF